MRSQNIESESPAVAPNQSGVRPSLADTPGIVLVIDDDEETRTIVCEILQGEGFETVAASSAGQALTLRRAGGWSPRVVLLDLVMPEMNGFDFLREARRENLLASSEVVLVTARGKEMSELRERILRKPFSLDDLLAITRDAMTGEPSEKTG